MTETGTIVVKLNAQTKRAAQHKALEEGLTISDLVRTLIEMWIAGQVEVQKDKGA